MIHVDLAFENLPPWAAYLTALFVFMGASLTLIGSIGILRLKSFYERLHAPTLGATLGTGLILIASMICFSVLRGQFSVHEILIALFLTLTTPVGFMLLARAALYRDRVEGNKGVPESGKYAQFKSENPSHSEDAS